MTNQALTIEPNRSLADAVHNEEVSAYSTSLELDSWVGDLSDSDGFASTELWTEFDPEGDEIVVSVVLDDGVEIVVHREPFQP